MKVLSLFSGVGGFDLGLERAGMQTVFQCEWDKHATRILERHWPDVPRWDDVSTLTGKHILQHAPVIDIVAWGSPCQDLSVAGKRAGLDGSRSGLFHEGIRIVKELQEETNGKYPRISLWENVYGALSSNKGADFGVILDEMAEAGALVQEWRVLDAQYFGVPQRRRRVFLVSIFDSATAARCPDPLLPVSQSVRRDTETSGTERQETARTIESSFASGSSQLTYTKAKRAQSTTDNETWVEGKPNPTLNAFDQGDTRTTTVIAFATNQRAELRDLEDKAVALSAEPGTNQTTFLAIEQERTYRNVTGALLGRDSFGPNHEGARDGKLILEPMLSFDTQFGSNANVFENHAPTLKASQAAPSVAIPIQDGRDIEKHQNGLGIGEEGAPSYTLDQTGAQAVAYGIQGTVIGRQDHNGPGGKGHTDENGAMYTLTSSDIHAVAYTLREREGKPGGGKGPLVTPEKSGTLAARANDQTVFQYDGYNQRIYQDDVSVTIRIGRDSSDFVAQPAQTTMAVRRLTPIECERLMGWPDGWTEGQADTHRYKQCGNGVASPVATWIAQHLQQLDKDTNATPTQTPTT